MRDVRRRLERLTERLGGAEPERIELRLLSEDEDGTLREPTGEPVKPEIQALADAGAAIILEDGRTGELHARGGANKEL